MTSLADARRNIGAVSGFRQRTDELKKQGQQDEDRSLRMARDAKTDEFLDESRDRTKEQWKQQDKSAAVTSETAQLKLEEAKQRVQDEGALEFLYEIDADGDPQQAAQRHNARGRSKMVDGTVQYDKATKRVAFDMDSDGDGKVEHFEYDVPKTIEQLERVTGKAKDRYMNVPDGSDVYDRRKGKIVATNPKDPTARGNTPIKQGPKDTILAPDGKTVLRAAPGGGGTGGGTGVTKFNPQSYSNDVTDALGKFMGGKYDPTTQQWDYGGATGKMITLNRIAQRHAQRLVSAGGAITADMIATVVAEQSQDFDPAAIRAEVKEKLKEITKGVTTEADYQDATFGLGEIKKDVLKHHQDAAIQDAIVGIDARVGAALDAEWQRLGKPSGEGLTPAETGVSTGDELPTDDEEEEIVDDEDPTATAADRVPAVDPNWPADAPPREIMRGLQEGYGRTVRRGGQVQVWTLDENGKPVRVK